MTGALAELLALPEARRTELGLTHTPAEIASQPALWCETARAVSASGLVPGGCVVFAGAGSSHWAGAQAAVAGLDRASAIATTDLVIDRAGAWEVGRTLVSLARSGDSPESVGAVRAVRSADSTARHIAVTCNPEGALAREARECGDPVIALPAGANDRGLAMTASFTCLSIAGAALISPRFAEGAEAAAAAVEGLLEGDSGALRDVAASSFDRAVFLASPWARAIAHEGALKLQELTDGRIATFPETYLGLRHGPQAMVRSETLVVAILSPDSLARRYERDLLAELRAKGQGSRFLLIGQDLGADEERLADDTVALPGSVDPLWQPLVAVVALQLLGLFASLREGLRPDSPSPEGVINRVVQGVRLHGV